MWFNPVSNFKLIGYTDSDWVGSVDNMKSTFAMHLHWTQEYFHGHLRNKKVYHNHPHK